MDLMARLFLEHPWPIYLAAGLAEIILLILWRLRQTPNSAKALAIPPAAALAVGLLATLVTTDRERIERAIDTLAAAAVAGDARTVGDYIDPAYRDPAGADATAIRIAAERALGAVDVTRCVVLSKEIEVRGSSAEARVKTFVDADAPVVVDRALLIEWRIRWRKRADDAAPPWRIISAEVVSPPGLRRTPRP